MPYEKFRFDRFITFHYTFFFIRVHISNADLVLKNGDTEQALSILRQITPEQRYVRMTLVEPAYEIIWICKVPFSFHSHSFATARFFLGSRNLPHHIFSQSCNIRVIGKAMHACVFPSLWRWMCVLAMRCNRIVWQSESSLIGHKNVLIRK